jgi:hypothetical protein
VSAEVSFTGQITRIKQRLLILAVHGIVLNAAIFFLSLSAFFLILKRFGMTNYEMDGGWYLLSIGISLLAALFIGILRRPNLPNVLIAIDQRLKLQDRLSTAYEYLKFSKKNEFTDLLLNDATTTLSQIKNKPLVPVKFSVLHLLALILLSTNILLYSGVFHRSDYRQIPPESRNIDNAVRLLKKFSIGRIENKVVQKSRFQRVYNQKLENLSNQLSDSSKPFKQRYAEMDRFLKEIEGEQARLADALAKKLDSAAFKDLGIQDIPDLANLSSAQLEKLKRLLSKTLNNQLPDSFNQTIESLQSLDRIENLISRILDDLTEGRSSVADSAEPAPTEQVISQSTDSPDDSPDAPNGPPSDGQFSHPSRNAADRNSPSGSGKYQRNSADLGGEVDQPEGHSASAGKGRSDEKKKSSYDIENSPGLALQDKIPSSPARSYLIHIRALTNTGEARLKEEEIYRTYRKEVESVLQKEDMPLNYREYIKNYFISIGLNAEKNAHESK